MSSPYKIYLPLDSYETENSLEENDQYSFFQPLLLNLVGKLKKFIKRRVNPFWVNFVLLSQDNSNTIKNLNDSPHLNLSLDIDTGEQIRILKIEILRSKLLSLYYIVKQRLDDNLSKFMERLKLKVEMQNFFNKDDNYLYILPKPKLFRFRTIYAYRRLLYVIKTYKYRVNFVMHNLFLRWKDLIIDYLPKNYLVEESLININENARNALAIKNVLEKIFSDFYYKQIWLFLSFYSLKFRAKNNVSVDEDYFISKSYTTSKTKFNSKINSQLKSNVNTGNNFLAENIFDFNDILKNCFNCRRKQIFEFLFPPVNFENISTTKQDEKILKFKNILKGLLLIEWRNQIDKKLAKYFYKWNKIIFFGIHEKKSENTNVVAIYYSRKKIIMGYKILHNFLFNNIGKLLPLKRKFYDKILNTAKLQNSLREYGRKYKNVAQSLSDSNLKANFYILRNIFAKLFSLHKIFLLISKKKYSFDYSNTNRSKYYNKYINLNDNAQIAFIHCFYKWKRIAFERYRKTSLRKWVIVNALEKIKNLVIADIKYKNDFIQRLKAIRKNSLNGNKIEILTKVLFYNCSNFITSLKKIIFNKLKAKYFFDLKLKGKMGMKLIQFYKGYSFDYIISNSKVKRLFNQWKSFSFKGKFDWKVLDSNSSKSILKLQYLVKKNYDNNLKFYFTKFKINLKNPNIIFFYKSKHVPRIDHYLIENQTKVLLDFEREENRLDQEIMKYRTSTNSATERFLTFMYKKHTQMLNFYFKTWVRNIKDSDTEKPQFINIINESVNVQNENEALISVYISTKSNYKKTIEDFEDVKAHFCIDCIGEEFEIDYKSVNDINSEEIGNEQETSLQMNTSVLDANFRLDTKDEITQKPNNQSLSNKVSEMEINIKNLQNVLDSKASDFNNQLKSFEDKKKELLEIKEKLLKVFQN